MRQLGVKNADNIFKVQLAVDEACTNIIRHAYSSEGKGMITIRCGLPDSGNKFVVNIKDRGKPFDPNSVPIPNAKPLLIKGKENGLGIFLMKKSVDNIKYTYDRKYNKLTMVKYLS